jgi:hypothetical protein
VGVAQGRLSDVSAFVLDLYAALFQTPPKYRWNAVHDIAWCINAEDRSVLSDCDLALEHFNGHLDFFFGRIDAGKCAVLVATLYLKHFFQEVVYT